jgi:hypothetical protein
MQNGGTKIVRAGVKITDLAPADFDAICGAIDMLDIKAVGSTCALIVNAHINTQIDTGIVCRSDVIGARGQPLTTRCGSSNTGAIMDNLILKCFIIQPDIEPKVGPYREPRRFDFVKSVFFTISRIIGVSDPSRHCKETTTLDDARTEYETQKAMYSITKSFMIPVCPDTLGLLVFTAADFAGFLSKHHIFGNNPVFNYLNEQLRSPDRQVGIMVMDAIPPNYAPLDKLKQGMPQFEHYHDLYLISAAIYCILITVAHKVPIDPHRGNWMGSVSESGLDVVAIDMGRILDLTNPANIGNLHNYIVKYFSNPDRLHQPPVTDLQHIMTAPDVFIATLMRIAFVDVTKLWNPVRVAPGQGTVPETNLNIIHQLFVLGACCDGFQNNAVFDYNFCQIRHILQQVYNNNHFESLDSIIANVNLDLNEYLTSLGDQTKVEYIIHNLQSISHYIEERTRIRSLGGGAQSRKKQTRRRYIKKRYQHRRGGIKIGRRKTAKHLKNIKKLHRR